MIIGVHAGDRNANSHSSGDHSPPVLVIIIQLILTNKNDHYPDEHNSA